ISGHGHAGSSRAGKKLSAASTSSERAAPFVGYAPRTAAPPRAAKAMVRGYWERCSAPRSKSESAGLAIENCVLAAAVPSPQRLDRGVRPRFARAHDEYSRDVVHAVAVFTTRCRVLGVLERAESISQPDH